MNQYSLLGKFAENSLSPKIYQILGNRFNIELNYEIILNIKSFKIQDYAGFNITNPYKKEFFSKYQDQFTCSKEAIETNYANTYNMKTMSAYNTDVYGLLKTLTENTIQCKKVAIIGAGDVCESIKQALKKNSPPDMIKVFNRTIKDKNILPLDAYKKNNFDLVFNTTPLSINHSQLFDLKYLNIETQSTLNGLSMLIWQALKNFEIWFDFKIPDKQKLKENIYEKLK